MACSVQCEIVDKNELLEQLLAPKKSETEILVVRPAPASSTAPTARA